MPITGPASYIPTCNAFLAHWEACNEVLPPAAPLLVRLENTDTTVNRGYLDGLTNALLAQQNVVQQCLTEQEIARTAIYNQKVKLLARFNQFNSMLDANYRGTDFYGSRPYAPNISDGQEVFSRAIYKAVTVWEELNEGPAPAGVTLPVVLPSTDETPGTMSVSAYASAVSTLQFAYNNELKKATRVEIAREKRNRMQTKAYEVLKAYREDVPFKMSAFPELANTIPRLTPLPGHTPDAVNASAVFEAPDKSKVVYDESTDPTLAVYQLRGNVGDEYSNEDAVVIATNEPGVPREFNVAFGLNQPGARVALKVYVILTTGNEAGSATMFVQRPVSAVA